MSSPFERVLQLLTDEV